MDTVRKVDLRFAPAIDLDNFVDCCRTKILTRIPIFFGASIYTNIEIEHFQMRRLVFVVFCAGSVNVRYFVESQDIIILDWRQLWHVTRKSRKPIKDM